MHARGVDETEIDDLEREIKEDFAEDGDRTLTAESEPLEASEGTGAESTPARRRHHREVERLEPVERDEGGGTRVVQHGHP